MARAVSALSPVIMTVRMPMRRSSANRSRMPSFTTSLSWTTPSTRGPSQSCTATSSGVPPAAATESANIRACGGTWPPRSSTQVMIWAAAPLRMVQAAPLSQRRSMPLIRVRAVNSTNCAWASSPCAGARRPYFFLACTTMERPSGVSSASDDSWAASARCSSSTPGSGMKASASRLPRVMVPVLSSSSVFTSPAASTARPDMASTLRCTRRSMPAMPMAERSAPIVVGISVTRSATSTVVGCAASAYEAIDCRLTTTSTNTMVSAASRMLRAISFGVFCRDAPSTREIIRSRKECPARDVTRTTIRSDSTVVPPVTPLRSPPDSRMTGADSPVTADSSTAATPSTTSPSAGISSPASTRTKSKGRSSVAATASVSASRRSVPTRQLCRSRRATVSVRALRSASACALPRPSATASARLAKTRVSHSQTLMSHENTDGSNTAVPVVITAPQPTTNSTGFLTSARGRSLCSASGNDFRTCTGSTRPPGRTRRWP